jgi:hypothetical protein
MLGDKLIGAAPSSFGMRKSDAPACTGPRFPFGTSSISDEQVRSGPKTASGRRERRLELGIVHQALAMDSPPLESTGAYNA